MSEEPDYYNLDIHKLDLEWVRQPRLYRSHARLLAEARRRHEKAKSALKLIKAEVEFDVRKNPQKYGLEKVTEPAIEMAVTISKAVKEADRKLQRAKHRVEIHEVDVETLHQRKAALGDLVKLFLADYFAEPKKPEGVTEEDMERLRNQTQRGRSREDVT